MILSYTFLSLFIHDVYVGGLNSFHVTVYHYHSPSHPFTDTELAPVRYVKDMYFFNVRNVEDDAWVDGLRKLRNESVVKVGDMDRDENFEFMHDYCWVV